MGSQDEGADLNRLFSQWKGASDASAQYATVANLLLARILGTVRAKTNWSAAKLQENLLKLGVENCSSFTRLADCLGEEIVRLKGPV